MAEMRQRLGELLAWRESKEGQIDCGGLVRKEREIDTTSTKNIRTSIIPNIEIYIMRND